MHSTSGLFHLSLCEPDSRAGPAAARVGVGWAGLLQGQGWHWAGTGWPGLGAEQGPAPLRLPHPHPDFQQEVRSPESASTTVLVVKC